MSTPQIKPLGQVQLGNTATLVYQCPSQPPNTVAQVDVIWICNTDTVSHTVTLRYGTGTLTAANSLLDAATIAAKTTYIIDSQDSVLTFQAGYKLEGTADVANMITVTASGKDFTS